LSWALVAALNLFSVFRRVGGVVNWRQAVLLPGLAAGAASALLYLLQDTLAHFLPAAPAALGPLAFCFILYFLLLMIWGSLSRRDVELLPGLGGFLGSRLQAWGFLRR